MLSRVFVMIAPEPPTYKPGCSTINIYVKQKILFELFKIPK